MENGSFVRQGIARVIPTGACYFGWQASPTQVDSRVEPKIADEPRSQQFPARLILVPM